MHLDARKDVLTEPLYVIAVISNPCRYLTRFKLYHDFEKYVENSGGILYTVETAFGERAHAVTDCNHGRHIQLRTAHELWHKENMINLGISRLPSTWKYVAWIDADVTFARPDWVNATLHQLQHFSIVQMFSEAYDLSPSHEIIGKHLGFAWCHQTEYEKNEDYNGGRYYGPKVKSGLKPGFHAWHPGFAWAARREFINHMGGLIDWGILGAGDNHMAKALIGDVHKSHHEDVHPAYADMLDQWGTRADRLIRRNLGHVPGALFHYWHGKKKDRRYWDRWQILVNNKFNPQTDIKRDWQGLWQLVDHGDDRSINLRNEIRSYFRGRSEDSIDL